MGHAQAPALHSAGEEAKNLLILRRTRNSIRTDAPERGAGLPTLLRSIHDEKAFDEAGSASQEENDRMTLFSSPVPFWIALSAANLTNKSSAERRSTKGSNQTEATAYSLSGVRECLRANFYSERANPTRTSYRRAVISRSLWFS